MKTAREVLFGWEEDPVFHPIATLFKYAKDVIFAFYVDARSEELVEGCSEESKKRHERAYTPEELIRIESTLGAMKSIREEMQKTFAQIESTRSHTFTDKQIAMFSVLKSKAEIIICSTSYIEAVWKAFLSLNT
jgi:hypothetical protein